MELYRESGVPEMLKELPMLQVNLGNLRGGRAAGTGRLWSTEPPSPPSSRLSAALLREERVAEALDAARRGLAIRSRYVPEDDQSLAGLWINLAVGEARSGNMPEARTPLGSRLHGAAGLLADELPNCPLQKRNFIVS